jgi:hypothetical protein
VQVHDKYQARGVVFVGLTVADRISVTRYVEQYHIPWLNGYGVTAETMSGLSALVPAEKPWVQPMLYVLGPDLRVRWHDGHARYRHVGLKKLVRELDAAIGDVLANGGRTD